MNFNVGERVKFKSDALDLLGLSPQFLDQIREVYTVKNIDHHFEIQLVYISNEKSPPATGWVMATRLVLENPGYKEVEL